MICILSDTHENLTAIDAALKVIREVGPDQVLHCGDIISPPTLKRFAGLPLRAVFGNNDGERPGLLRTARECGFGEMAEALDLEIGGKSFHIYHGTDPARLEGAILSQHYDYVCTGHTHAVRDERCGRTRVINPGALFMVRPWTMALLDLAADTFEIVEIE